SDGWKQQQRQQQTDGGRTKHHPGGAPTLAGAERRRHHRCHEGQTQNNEWHQVVVHLSPIAVTISNMYCATHPMFAAIQGHDSERAASFAPPCCRRKPRGASLV